MIDESDRNYVKALLSRFGTFAWSAAFFLAGAAVSALIERILR